MEIIQDLTKKQKNVLGFIQNKISRGGIAPTIREIAKHFGFSSTGTVRDYLSALSRKGYLSIAPRKSRHIELKRRLGFRLPILGNVMAGVPNLAFEQVDDFLDLDDLSSKPDKEIFVLNIKGDSLIDAGILDGDLALVKKQSFAQNGDLVVALLENEATVKRLRYKDKKIWLEPANKNYSPIHKEFTIIGRVIAVLRKF
ncbi:MAG: transcriptional repressor LexA [Candidatus Omnitrophota bacterium]|nr:transcriptional repressor LexA [Candidatus Omnitrophota bacterium]